MSEKNTAPEFYDEEIQGKEKLTQEDILMNEKDLLAGLLELGKTKDRPENYRKIQIKRNKKVLLEFRIRPISEDEVQMCLKKANKYTAAKHGQPRKLISTDNTKFRSLTIYTATVDEDRAKIWDNEKAQEAYDIFEGWEMIDKVLLVGEKDRILDVIDEISGIVPEAEDEGENAEKTAKN